MNNLDSNKVLNLYNGFRTLFLHKLKKAMFLCIIEKETNGVFDSVEIFLDKKYVTKARFVA